MFLHPVVAGGGDWWYTEGRLVYGGGRGKSWDKKDQKGP